MLRIQTILHRILICSKFLLESDQIFFCNFYSFPSWFLLNGFFFPGPDPGDWKVSDHMDPDPQHWYVHCTMNSFGNGLSVRYISSFISTYNQSKLQEHNIRRNFFTNWVINTWYSLPNDVKDAANAFELKSVYDKLWLPCNNYLPIETKWWNSFRTPNWSELESTPTYTK